MTRAHLVLLCVLVWAAPSAVQAETSNSVRRVIASAYARMDAAASRKDANGVLAAYGADWVGVGPVDQVRRIVTEAELRSALTHLFALAQSVEAKTTVQKLTPAGQDIAVHIGSHVVVITDSPNDKASFIETNIDEVRDDIWGIRGHDWTLLHSNTVSSGTVVTLARVVLETAPSPAPAEPPDRVLTGHRGRVSALAFSPDGALLVSGGSDKTVRVWDSKSGRLLRTLRGDNGPVQSVAISPDGHLLAAGSGRSYGPTKREGEVDIWDVTTGSHVRVLRRPHAFISALAFSPDGLRLVTGADDPSIVVLDVASGKQVRTLEQPSLHRTALDSIRQVLFQPTTNGKTLVSFAYPYIQFWDIGAGTRKHDLFDEANAIALSPDGHTLACGGETYTEDTDIYAWARGEVRLYDAQSNHLIRSLVWPEEDGFVVSVAFSPDGATLAAATTDQIILWDVKTGKVSRTITTRYGVTAIAYSPDGSTLAYDSDRGVTVLYSLR